jgi:hypothetical protein
MQNFGGADHPSKLGSETMIRGAQMIFNRGDSIIQCTVVDFTGDGAMVKTIPGKSIPRFFVLELADGLRFNCECADRTKDMLDVKFKSQAR